MEFSSLTFILIFLPIFTVIELVVFNIELRNIFMLLFSLTFIVLSDVRYLYLFLLIALLTYVSGLFVKGKKWLYGVYLVTIVLLLAFFKYGNYLLESILSFTGFESIISPLGISFITFTSISYVSDVYYGKIEKEKNILNILNFMLFFPTFISGPILRYGLFSGSLKNRKVDFETVSKGFKRFALGLFKKVVIADHLALVVETAFGVETTMAVLSWYGLIAYSIELLMDFDGYSDMAIGIAWMAGFEMPENFDKPYLSTSVAMFWRRWHMTLGSWFRDYVYIPLGGNRVSYVRWIMNIMIVWCLTGIWHGATANFIIWGLYYGVLLIIEKYIRKNTKDSILYVIPVQLLVLLGWLIFRSADIETIKNSLAGIFSFNNLIDYKLLVSLNVLYLLPYLVIGILLSMTCYPRIEKAMERFPLVHSVLTIVILVVSLFFIVTSSYTSFIYFGF